MSRSTATTGPDRRRRWAVAALLVALLGLGFPYGWERFLRDGLPELPLPDESTLVLDHAGRTLRIFTAADGRWRLPATHDAVDPRFRDLLIASEDRRFFEHHGVDAIALARAATQLVEARRIVSGGSTLTMQVARLLEPRRARAFGAKTSQILRALWMENRLGKGEILDLYLRLAPYGGNLQGIRAASLAYFGHEPRRLSLAEAALLVALPQSPERRRLDRFPDRAEAARDRIIDRAVAMGLASAEEAASARAEAVPRRRRAFPALAAQATEQARKLEPAQKNIRLTIDAPLQASLERLVHDNAARFGPAVSGAVLVVDNASGNILAHVGSGNAFSRRNGDAIDMVQAFRSPGSALKPFIYAMAFEHGIALPETILEDRPTHYGTYAPENFDGTFHGSVSARRALQLSLNLPAVALLDRLGPARFLARLREAGAEIEVPAHAPPGLAIGLGGLGIRLVDLARLYAALARGGEAPVLRESLDRPLSGRPRRPVAEATSSWFITDILRGAPPPVNAPAGRIAFKTGTSYGYRDAWAVGYTKRATIAAWLGRPDNAAVPGLVGRQAAAPILFDAFARLGGSLDAPLPPPGAELQAREDPPSPLRRLAGARAGSAAIRISYPPDGSTVDLGGQPSLLALKVEGGSPPFTWFVDGVPAGPASLRRQAGWTPDGLGFVRVSVSDASGSGDSVSVRLR